jgi:hypothetical protein
MSNVKIRPCGARRQSFASLDKPQWRLKNRIMAPSKKEVIESLKNFVKEDPTIKASMENIYDTMMTHRTFDITGSIGLGYISGQQAFSAFNQSRALPFSESSVSKGLSSDVRESVNEIMEARQIERQQNQVDLYTLGGAIGMGGSIVAGTTTETRIQTVDLEAHTIADRVYQRIQSVSTQLSERQLAEVQVELATKIPNLLEDLLKKKLEATLPGTVSSIFNRFKSSLESYMDMKGLKKQPAMANLRTHTSQHGKDRGSGRPRHGL